MSFIDVAIIQCHNIKNGTPIIEPISFTIRYWTFSRTGGKSSILNRWNKDMRKALTNPLVIRSLSTTGRKWALSPIMTSGVRGYLPRRFHMDWNLFGFSEFCWTRVFCVYRVLPSFISQIYRNSLHRSQSCETNLVQMCGTKNNLLRPIGKSPPEKKTFQDHVQHACFSFDLTPFPWPARCIYPW